MTLHKWTRRIVLLCLLQLLTLEAHGQAANASPQFVFAGLRSLAGKGQMLGVQADAAGELFVLYDQGDGVQVLKIAKDGTSVLAQAHLGARGDSGVALVLDPMGNVYVTGTTSSGVLATTSGAALNAGATGTTQSFVAKLNPGLTLEWLTFTGGSRIVASALSANADHVFVTGITYGSDLPVTANAIEQSVAPGSTQNGFAESFSADGTTLSYATYLTGAQGDTTPSGIAVDASGNAWLAGSTTATGFPTIAAIVPERLSPQSGFLMQLTPAGDAIVWSTFVPGSGLNAVALDSTGQVLLVAGGVSLGDFPVDTATAPLVNTDYQVLLRISLDGGSVLSGTVIAPGLQSTVVPGEDGSAWIGGTFPQMSAPMLPIPPLSAIGSGFAAHVTSSGGVDTVARMGGLPDGNLSYASLPIQIQGLAVAPTGELLIAGTVQPTASSSLLGTQTYDLPQRGETTAALPSSLRDAEVVEQSCAGSLCSGSAGYLGELDATAQGPSLALSIDDLPRVTLRNLGSAAAAGLNLVSSAGTLSTNCLSTLAPGAECDALLTAGGVSGTISASTSNGGDTEASYTATLGTTSTSGLVFAPKELDFGITTSAGTPNLGTVTVSNLGAAPEAFVSGTPLAHENVSPFAESESDCPLSENGSAKVLAAGASCHITIGFTATAGSTNDGFLQAAWNLGDRQLLLTGYSQAASVSVSTNQIHFGTVLQGGPNLPRYLYLSNGSRLPVAHAPVTLPTGSPFRVEDGCPSLLAAGSICRLRIDYQAASAPSSDSVDVVLDQGILVQLSGVTEPAVTLSGSSANPVLSVSPRSSNFSDAVVVTSASTVTQNVSVTNAGSSATPLALKLTGDFIETSSCGATLAAGATCVVSVRFNPSQPGARQGLLSVSSGSDATPISVTLSGTGTGLLASNNGNFDSGGVPVGQPLVRFYEILQPFDALSVATTGPYRVTLVEDVGYGHGQPPSSAFATSGTGTCHHCWVGVRFQPIAVGLQAGTLTFSSDPLGRSYGLTLTGSGLATSGLVLSPNLQSFGAIPVHSSSGSVLFTLTNMTATGALVTVGSPQLTGDFVSTPPPSSMPACSGVLAYAASCFVEVRFSPSQSGELMGELTLSTGDGSATASLSGTGTSDPGVSISPLALNFLMDPGPISTQQVVTVTNTGGAPVQIGAPSVASSAFQLSSSCGLLAPGALCTVSVSFLPESALVTGALSIPVTNNAGEVITYSVALNGGYTSSAAGLVIVPGSTEFGPAPTGSAGGLRQYTVSNLTGKALTLTVGLPQQFSLSGAGCSELQPQANCSFLVESDPLVNGDIAGTLSVQGVPADGGSTLSTLGYAESFGIGSGTLVISGGLLANGVFSFGQVASGQSATQTFQLANQGPSGGNPITVRRVTSADPFLSTTTCGTALGVGETCTVTVTYTPSNQIASGSPAQSSLSDAGVLTIESDAQSSPNVIHLSGLASPVAVAFPDNSERTTSYSLSKYSVSFPATTVGYASPPQTVTLTNTGDVAMHVSAFQVSSDFTVQSGCQTILASQSCSFSLTSIPQTEGSHRSALEISTDATTSLEFVSLVSTGIASPLSISASALDFGSVGVGSTSSLPLQVTNLSGSAITFSGIATQGDYSVSGSCPSAGGVLAAHAGCSLNVSFSPSSVGVRTGTLTFASSASAMPLAVALKGTGTQPALIATPANLKFGGVQLGSSSSLLITITNRGSTPVSSLAASASGDYSIPVPCAQTTLAVGEACNLQVLFSPIAVGGRNGTLSLGSSDPTSPLIVPLTGTGVSLVDFTLTVSGADSASVTLVQGQFATFAASVTPTGTYNGSVALTCLPVETAVYANCSVLPPSVSLSGGPQTATATINTITLGNAVSARGRAAPPSLTGSVWALMLPGLLMSASFRRRARRWLAPSVIVLSVFCLLPMLGCGGGEIINVNYTPAGTYHFLLTGSTTSGTAASHTVTLTLIVNSR